MYIALLTLYCVGSRRDVECKTKHGSTFAFDFTTVIHQHPSAAYTGHSLYAPTSVTTMSMSTSHLPALQPSTSYSFYPYPLNSIPTTSLRGLAHAPTQPQAGPSNNHRAEVQQATRVRERAERRALVGQRPAGFAVGRESEDLDLEEMALDDERVSLPKGSMTPI